MMNKYNPSIFILNISCFSFFSHFQKYSRLTTTLKVICQIEQSRRFGPQLIVKHLTDILAVFLQICHAPLRKPTTDLEIQLWTRLQNERKQFIPLFNDIISRAHPPLLVQSLLLLQGPSPSHAKIIRVRFQL